MRLLNFFSLQARFNQGQPRRRVKPIWRQPVLIIVFLSLVVAATGGGGWWIWKIGWTQDLAQSTKWKFLVGSAKSGFSVGEIFVQGRIETSKKMLLQALRLYRGAPILTFDPEQALDRITALPWVRTAVIERQLPDLVYLSLVERRPLALWQHKGRFALIDTKGEIIPLLDIGRFSNLVVVVGGDAPKHASQLMDTLAVAPELAKRVKAAVRVGGRRWDIQMNNKVEVRLPESNSIAAWVQLAEMQLRHQFLEKDVMTVDLRLPNRIILRWLQGIEKPVTPILESTSNQSNQKSRQDT